MQDLGPISVTAENRPPAGLSIVIDVDGADRAVIEERAREIFQDYALTWSVGASEA